MELYKIILAVLLDKVHLILHNELFVHEPEHIGDIQDHIVGDILEHESELIVIKSGPESGAVLIERI